MDKSLLNKAKSLYCVDFLNVVLLYSVSESTSPVNWWNFIRI